MATKKFLSLERLQEYDSLLKQEIANAVSSKADASHNHSDIYYDKNQIDTKLDGKANSSHGNHVPTTETANNAKFLRNDNTWAIVTPANIGAAESSHNHSASNIDSGTLSSDRLPTVPVAKGGTGATTAEAARTSLSVYSTSEVDTKVANAVSGLASTSSVNTAISTHNSDATAHSDIRATLAEVKEDVDAFFKDATISTAAKDTLKEIQDYITSDATAAAEMTAAINGKADKATTLSGYGITNAYTKTEVDNALDGKADSSHGTHVLYSTTAPVMDGTASAGSAATVARSDHKHPTDTSRASKTEFDTHTSNTTAHITSDERTKWNAAKTHADSAHAPSNAEKNQNAFSNVKVGSVTVAADTTTDTFEIAAGTGISVAGDATNDKVTITNSGVISVSTGTANGTISVNTNGTSANVAVKGLGSAAYTNSSAYATSDHTHTVDTALSSTSTNPVQNKIVNSAITTLTGLVSTNTSSISAHTDAIGELQDAMSEIQEITSAEISALFA